MTDDARTDEPDPALRLPAMSRRMQRFSMFLFFALGAAVAAFVVGNPLRLGFLPGAERGGASESAAPITEILYQCPMHPEVIESGPADCPICGMDLVPMHEAAPHAAAHSAAEPGPAAGTIEIDPVQVQNIGVVSTPARVEEIARGSRTVGILDFDADRITRVNTKVSGWIEKVHVNYVGQEVRTGEPLFEIYSPELVTTQEEYLRALDYRASLENSDRAQTRRQAESLVRSARERLAYWDISPDQIADLEESRQVQRSLTIRSPVDGVVAQVMEQALEGMFVKPGMDLYRIADLSTVWVHADVYESDLPWVREGQPAVVSFRHDPERSFQGSVLFLYPEVSKETRTLKVCVVVPNADGRLRPGMYADVLIQGPPVRAAVVIPQSAVLRSGERDLIFVDLGQGRFEPREVSLGVFGAGDRVQVLRGVEAGEAVVTQAQFMLDSESRLQEAIAKFRERGTEPAAPPAHRH